MTRVPEEVLGTLETRSLTLSPRSRELGLSTSPVPTGLANISVPAKCGGRKSDRRTSNEATLFRISQTDPSNCRVHAASFEQGYPLTLGKSSKAVSSARHR